MKTNKSNIIKRAKKIRLLAMDVDGVLTDGSIVVLESGEEVKSWSVKDRMGFFMLSRSGAGFLTAWITGRKSRQVEARAREIGIDAVFQDCNSKGRAFLETVKRFALRPEEALFVGDDLVDLPALRMAGLAVCPCDAHEEVKKVCDYVTKAPGGKGALREVVDLVLKAQGLYKKIVDSFEI